MTKKERLIELVNKLMKEDESLLLFMSLPYCEDEYCETIHVKSKYLKNKLYYIEENYNDDLEMKHNPKVKIISFL